jgi:hypothetical protein
MQRLAPHLLWQREDHAQPAIAQDQGGDPRVHCTLAMHQRRCGGGDHHDQVVPTVIEPHDSATPRLSCVAGRMSASTHRSPVPVGLASAPFPAWLAHALAAVVTAVVYLHPRRAQAVLSVRPIKCDPSDAGALTETTQVPGQAAIRPRRCSRTFFSRWLGQN